MDRRRIREEAIEALMNGGSYRETVETEAAMGALDGAPTIHMQVPIRFRKRYEDMRKELDGTDPDS
jgi:hypothetical protein